MIEVPIGALRGLTPTLIRLETKQTLRVVKLITGLYAGISFAG